jgi:serine phosphatase RsbU (regulator of sigma subunit)
VLEGFEYPLAEHALAPGEWVCVVTDGVTEAMNPAGELYGAKRLHEVLRSLAEDVEADAMLAAVRADVGRFVGAAEPSDDLTLLCLRWRGPASGR